MSRHEGKAREVTATRNALIRNVRLTGSSIESQRSISLSKEVCLFGPEAKKTSGSSSKNALSKNAPTSSRPRASVAPTISRICTTERSTRLRSSLWADAGIASSSADGSAPPGARFASALLFADMLVAPWMVVRRQIRQPAFHVYG
jgi:hypothetical protein